MKKIIITTATLLNIILTALIINSCKEDFPEPAMGTNNNITLTLSTDAISYTYTDLIYGINYLPEFNEYESGICFDTLESPTVDKSKSIINNLSNIQTKTKAEDLLPFTNYYARAYYKLDEKVLYSEQTNWRTLDARPIIQSQSVEEVLAQSAKVKVSVTVPNGFALTKRGVCWATSENPDLSDSFTSDSLGNGAITSNINGLTADVTYYVRAYASNKAGNVYGVQLTFKTGDGKPTLTTAYISNISANSALSGGNISSDGNLAVTARGVCWATNTNPTLADNKTTDGSGIGSFTSNITGLTPAIVYYVRAYATNSLGTVYGNEQIFTTTGLPELITADITNITATAATSGGSITADGGFAITSRGVCWSTVNNPTVSDNITNDGSGLGSFNSNLTDLIPGTTYYVRAYATNSLGTAYGNEQSFISQDGLAKLTTNAITDITGNNAIGGGNITSDGGFAITERGVCWSTSSNPTLADNKTTDGSGIGNFSSNITGLIPATTYYIRAYATNSGGTFYGNEINFETPEQIVDYDGNTYTTVNIGTQKWMASNLKVTHYPNGTAIPLVTNNDSWAILGDNNTDDAYCYYENLVNGSNTYGALYTYAAAKDACPTGWHLPNESEFQTLKTFLANNGHAGAEGTALKSTSGWSNNGNGTDNYGFNAKPGAYRMGLDGKFGGQELSTYFWGAENNLDASLVWNINLGYYSYMGSGYTNAKSYGNSVRCIKD